MSRRSRRIPAFATIAALLLAASSVLADGKPTPEMRRARAAFDEGVALSDEGKWADALSAFQRWDDLVNSASVRFNIGASLRALGRYVEAKKVLEGVLAKADAWKPPLKPALKKDIEKLLGEVNGKIVRVALKVSPAGADVQADGAPLAMLLDGRAQIDPGRHVFVVTAAGHDTTTVTKTLAPTDTELVLTAPKSAVVVAAAPAPRPFYARAWFITTAGLVVAGAAAAVIIVVAQPKSATPAGPPNSSVERVVPAAFRF